MSKEALRDKECCGERDLSLPNDIARFEKAGLLSAILYDRTTGENIIWATSAYAHLGEGFAAKDPIAIDGITGEHANNIRRRAQKDKDERTALTRAHAEVFTPAWIVKFMVDAADEGWRESLTLADGQEEWQAYVASPRLEITCGEGPYLVNRYDAADGLATPLNERTGILSRKLALVNEHAKTRDEWMQWAKTALQTIYGYEFQGDNLLIARVNVLCTLEDYLRSAGFEDFTAEEYAELAGIISWNLWQMDGLTKCIPFGTPAKDKAQTSMFDLLSGALEEEPLSEDCIIYDWKNGKQVKFADIRKGSEMKFDYIIGNPPYQEETEGTSDKPIYDKFMDGTFEVGDRVELITPARFLFDAGKTPKAWNRKMLDDPHFKVIEYFQKSREVFPSTDIKGGVAITYRDANIRFGEIGTFTIYEELNTILHKVLPFVKDVSLDDLIIQQNKWNLDALYDDHPEYKKLIGSGGTEKRLTTPIFTALEVFEKEPKESYLKILGLVSNKREYRYIDPKYIDTNHKNLKKFKVVVPASNGSGVIGEVLSTPLIGAPLIGFTQSFISFGSFDTDDEASALLSYIKTKFARTMLGTLKITQHNHKGTWVNVPLQDFTSSSDIDWSQSVAGIDVQLYKKYGLSDEEIEFIETHVKEMQ